MKKPLVLILCTGNSCRSQMAEAFLRAAAGDILEVASAGTNPAGYVHPLAVQVMAECGFDLSSARSKSLAEFSPDAVDAVVTVCGGASEECPVYPTGVWRLHIGFEDPAAATGSEADKLAAFRRVRDAIRARFEALAVEFRRDYAGRSVSDSSRNA